MRTNIPSIAVSDTIGKHNEELLRDPKTGLMPWETRPGRLLRRLKDTGKCIAKKVIEVMFASATKASHVFFAAASQRMKKRR